MIHVGQILLLVALGTGVLAFAAKVRAMQSDSQRMDALYRSAMLATAALLVTTFLYLCVLFLTPDLSVLYVWTYTGTWIPWEYRLAGAWTGREGSLLLWTAFTAMVVAGMALRPRIEDEELATTKAGHWTDLVMAAILIAFLVAVARQGTFAPTESFLLAGRPAGNGINPSLLSPYILIHPPMMFLAYAMTIVPAAAGIGHMIGGTNRWSTVAARISRVDWVLYTFAMGLGGLWAYYTLGFGGYWAWDPVEVANLLPWLALTIYLHAQMMHRRRGWFAGMGPMLAVLPFVLTVFSTVSTRSGLWVSVHAFTDPSNSFNPDAAARLLGILQLDPSLLPFFGMLLGILLISMGLWCRRLATDHDAMQGASRAIAAILGIAGGMAWVAPALFLSLVFEAGALVGSPGLGALALLGFAALAAASPSLIRAEESNDDEAAKGWTRWVAIAPLAALSVLLLSLLLVVSIMWHFAAVNGWSETFWDARIPWMLTPVVLALVVMMLRGRGAKNAVQAAGALLAGGIAVFTIGGIGYYSVFMAGGFFLAALDKMKAISFTGSRPIRWRAFLLWVAALLDLVFWVDPTTSMVFGTVAGAWPQHLVMIPLSVLAIVGAHLVGIGRPLKWPFLLAAVLGGYYIAPVLVFIAWNLGKRETAPTKPLILKRIRPIGVYGVHFALAVLMLGYGASTYFEAREDFEITEEDGAFTLGGGTYQMGLSDSIAGGQGPVTGAIDQFQVRLQSSDGNLTDGATASMEWESQTGTYRPVPGVLRLWDRDLYVVMDAVCILDLDAEGQCPPDGWIEANQRGRLVLGAQDPTAFRFTAWSLPGVNLVWAGLALFVTYGIPVAFLSDGKPLHRPKASIPAATKP